MHTMKMIYHFARVWLLRFSEYRGTLFLQVLSNAVHYLSEMFVIWVLIDRFERIGNWGGYEVVLLFAMDWLSYGIANFFIRFSFRYLEEHIRTGDFDEFLIRPMKPAAYFMFKKLEFYDLNFIIVNAIVLAFIFYKMEIVFTLFKVFWLIIIMFGATLIQTSLILYTSIASFWFIKTESLSRFIVLQTNDFNKYPISIYPRFIQIILTFIVPWAFVNFYPVQYFIQKQDFLFFHPIIQYLTPVIGLCMLILAILLWKLGLKRYQSTGT